MKGIHYTLRVKKKDQPDSSAWDEVMKYNVEDGVSEEEHGRGIVEMFNQTRREGEVERVFISAVPVSNEEKAFEHNWEKMSLVTEVGGYDRYECSRCGAKGKKYGLSERVVLDYNSRKKKECIPSNKNQS